mgnify:CR=1 FL=1
MKIFSVELTAVSVLCALLGLCEGTPSHLDGLKNQTASSQLEDFKNQTVFNELQEIISQQKLQQYFDTKDAEFVQELRKLIFSCR